MSKSEGGEREQEQDGGGVLTVGRDKRTKRNKEVEDQEGTGCVGIKEGGDTDIGDGTVQWFGREGTHDGARSFDEGSELRGDDFTTWEEAERESRHMFAVIGVGRPCKPYLDVEGREEDFVKGLSAAGGRREFKCGGWIVERRREGWGVEKGGGEDRGELVDWRWRVEETQRWLLWKRRCRASATS